MSEARRLLLAANNDPAWVVAVLRTTADAGCEVVPAGTEAERDALAAAIREHRREPSRLMGDDMPHPRDRTLWAALAAAPSTEEPTP